MENLTVGTFATYWSTICSRGTDRNVFSIKFFTIFAFLILAGCVSNTTLPSRNIGTLLTPTEGDKPESPANNLETKLVAAETATEPKSGPTPPPAKKEELSPAVKSALVPTTKETSAQAAAGEVVQPKTATAPSTTTKPETQVAALKPESKPAPKPVVKKKSTSLFGGFFNSNQAGKPKSTNNAASRSDDRGGVRTITSNRSRRTTSSNGSLPGVSLKRAFGLDTDDTDELDEPVQVASVASRARRGTHGLLLQRKDVKVGCFPPQLVRLLKRVERRFGRTPIVTSGYRSKSYNRRIRGARNSMHIYCKAADIQVKGVSKWTLAKYLRSLPGRGGVGTYCHTKSVHIDIATKRDWNRRCRRARRRRS